MKKNRLIYTVHLRFYVVLYVALIGISGILFSCEDDIRGPIGGDGQAPGPVSNVTYQPGPGSVKLTYDLPNSKNLLYVKAEVEVNGRKREVKSSFYENTLQIEGFGNTNPYTVTLYAVGRDETVSTPMAIEVTPLKAAVISTFESIDLFEDFGGASVRFTNESEGDLSFFLLTKDEAGDWQEAYSYYSKRQTGFFSARGFTPVQRTFGVYVQDRWNNRSDTLVRELVPVYEERLDRTKFAVFALPGDETSGYAQWDLHNIWDGSMGEPGFLTNINGVWPQHVTFSLGPRSKLSRFKFWQRTVNPFERENIRKFEIWGSNSPALDGSYDGWEKLMDGESIRPSGLAPGTALTTEDRAKATEGEEFDFPADIPAVKYIRLRVTETWARGRGQFALTEVAFWGAADE